MQKNNTPTLSGFKFAAIGAFLFLILSSASGQCPNPVTPCLPAHQTTIDLSTVPLCGVSSVSIEGDIQSNQSDCLGTANSSWKCHQFTITRPDNSTLQQFTLKIGQGGGCTGELDASYAIINGTCTQLSNGGSNTSITFSFPIGVNSMILDLCLNSSSFVTICNLCTQPPPCTTLPQCNLSDVSITGCKSNVPAAATNPSDVFTNTGTCSAMLQMTHTDVGDTSFCTAPPGVNFVRTYILKFFDGTSYVDYRQCVQNIQVIPATSNPVITTCAVTRTVQGCNTGAITDPPYSTTTATSTEAVFEDATNQGNTSNSCGIASVKYIDVSTGSCPIVVTRKWTVSDDCGNSASCNQTINVNDTTSPTISVCAKTRTIEGCTTTSAITDPPYSTTTAASSEAVFEDATNQGNTSDACGITSVTYIDIAAGTCPTVVTRNWTVTDACGNSSTCNQTINVGDTAPPAISACAVTRTIQGCNTGAITDPVYSTTTTASSEAVFEDGTNQGNSSDACGITSVTYVDVSTGTCPIVVTRKWTVTDACGHSSTCNQTINVNDTTPPTIVACAVPRAVQGCGSGEVVDPPYSPITASSSEAVFEDSDNQGNVSDACGVTSVKYKDMLTGTCPTIVTRTWTISDACGNSASCNQVYLVTNSLPPMVTANAVTRTIAGCDTTGIADPPFSSVVAVSSNFVFEDPTNQGADSDACGITAVTYIDVIVNTFPLVILRTWTLANACGLTAASAQSINVTDVTPPTVTCAVTRSIEGCNVGAITDPPFSASTAASSEAVFEDGTNQGNASDDCNIGLVAYIDVAAGTCPTVVSRKWTITDGSGHSSTCIQTINVNDTTSPVISACAATRTIEGCNTGVITSPPFSTTLTASTEVEFESAPNNGNTSDACGITAVTYIDIAAGTCPTVVTRRWTVTDACGHSATCNQTINVNDTTSPVISACAVTRTIEGCNTGAITSPPFSTTLAASTEAVFESAPNSGNTSDACGITSVTYIDVAAGTCPTVVTRHWTVSDACGHSSTCNQTINVNDTTNPAINACAVTRTIEGCNTGAITDPVFSTTAAASSEGVFEDATNLGNTSDACGITSVTYIDVAAGTCPTVVTRKWTVSDACGHSSTCNQTINVNDTTVPTITACAATRTVQGCNTGAITDPAFSTTVAVSSEAVFEDATNLGNTSDACGITIVTYIDAAAGTCPTVVTRKWTVSDACGHSSTCNQTINVNDTTVPSITACAVTRTIQGCNTGAITDPVFSATVTASTEGVFEDAINLGNTSDACGITTVTYIDVAAGTCPTVVTRRWTVGDACGNTSTCNQTINVNDTTVPTITACAVTRTIQGCNTGAITDPVFSATVAVSSEGVFEDATNLGNTSDACGITTVTYIDVAAGTCPTVVTRRWTVGDACGNTSTCNQTINVNDTTVPTITACAVTRTIQGCNTGAITDPVFSATVAVSSEGVFEDATNLGNTSDACGITTVTYIDVAAGTCPTVVTRRWTVGDACGNTSTCNQTINVNDTTVPTITACAVTRTIQGCNTGAITDPVFSTTVAVSSEGVFEDATNLGNTSDACGITTVTYIDVAAGTCPTVVTRRWTVGDACGNTSTCNQTINVNDTTVPTITACAVTRTIQGCSTGAITDPVFSTTVTASTEGVFEDATNLGNTSDACGITTVTYIDVAAGTCPTVVTRRWTVGDACGNTSTCNQTINVNDTTVPTITACAVTRTIQGCNTGAITDPVFSATVTASTEGVFEDATNLGNTSDACGITTVTYIDVAAGTCPTVVTRRWTVGDACGNTSTCNQTINVNDTTVPTITACAVTRTIQGCNTGAITDPVFSATVTASTEGVFEDATNLGNTSDACGITTVTYIDVAAGTCPTVVTRRWTVGDACGNTSTCNQTINVNDTTVPTITACAVTRTIQGCNTGAITDPVFSATVTASTEGVFEDATNLGNTSDACGITTVTYIDVAAGTCPTVVTRRWTVGDACGNTSTCNQTINVNDTTVPTITACAVTRTIQGCNTGAITDPVFSATVTASTEGVFEDATNLGNTSDACGITTVTYIDVAAGTCPTVVTRRWTVGDACGNTSTCNQTINVNDTTVPTITACAVTRTIQGCNTGAITDPVFSATVAVSSEGVFEDATNLGNTSDACGITTVTYIDVAAGTCPTVVTRRWTVGDACGNTSTCNQTINVNDTTVPTITACAVTRTIQGCNTGAITDPVFSATVTASTEGVFEDATNLGNTSDACGITTVTYIDVATGTCPTVVTRKWTVGDACGNTSTCNQTINVNDTTAPTITACAVTRTIEGCNTGAITDPVFSTTATASTEAVFEDAINLGNTSDACGITSVTYIDVAAGTCPTVVTRKWTVSDACGHSSTCNQTINVNDTTNPVITACAVTRTIEGCNTGAITSPAFSATLAASTEAVFESAPNNGNTSDACGITSVTYIDVAAGTCPTVVTRKWTVSDACGHSATCNQTINVNDTTNPVISACAVARTIQGCNTGAITDPPFSPTGDASSEAVFEDATNQGNASDACGITSVTYIDLAFGTCPIQVTRKWTVTDACGHSASCNQSINIFDTTPPAIVACAVTRTIQGCNTGAITDPVFSTTVTASTEGVFEDATNQGNASDACGITTVTYIDAAAGTCPTVVTRRWTVGDACGNTSTCNQTINVGDTTPPTITACAVTRSFEGCGTGSITDPPFSATTATSSEAVFEDATNLGNTSDACGITSVKYIDITNGTCPMVVTRKWTISDACGNSSTCNQTINVDDNTNPAFTLCPSELVLNCEPESNYSSLISAWLATATATDNCDASVAVTNNYDGMSIPLFSCEGGLSVTFTATDDCGNTATCIGLIRKPCFNVDAWVYLEGSSVVPNGSNNYVLPMRTSLNDLRVLPGQTLVDPFFGNKYTPPGQPYNIAPWNYFGNEGDGYDSGGDPMMASAGYPPTVVDWILVSLRADSAGTNPPICEAAALLHSDGHVEYVEPWACCNISETIPYYIVIEHRNHLIVMSHQIIPWINHRLSYDFRFQQSWEDPLFAGLGIFAREKEILPGKFAMFAGNGDQTSSLNSDTDINFNDRSYWEAQNGDVGEFRIGDYNQNGDTNFNDRVVWERNNGKFTSVPRN